MSTRTGPEVRKCKLCPQHDMAPVLGPYHTFRGKMWAHAECIAKMYRETPMAERHENGDGV